MQLFNLLLAIFLPYIIVSAVMLYLRSALSSVLVGLCGRKEYADFWIRSATILALSASWVLTLLFTPWSNHADMILILRQQLLLISAGIFISAAWIARSVWRNVFYQIHSHKSDTPLSNTARSEV